MVRAIYRRAHVSDAGGDPRGRFVMHYHHRLVGVLTVLTECRFQEVQIDASPPVARNEVHLQAEPPGHRPPAGSEETLVEHQHLVTR